MPFLGSKQLVVLALFCIHSTAKTRWTDGFQVILLKALNISLAGYWIIVFQNPGNKRLDSKKTSLLQQPLKSLETIEISVGKSLL